MKHGNHARSRFWRTLTPLAVLACASLLPAQSAGERNDADQAVSRQEAYGDAVIESSFEQQIRPLLNSFCFDCHNADTMESGIRVDGLNGQLAGRSPYLWTAIRKQLGKGAMPPKDEPQPAPEQRQAWIEWIDKALMHAKRRPRDKNGSLRRLTVAQYRNTLRDLLGIDDDFSDLLPPDAVSKDGFLNNEQTLELSPLQIEAYFDIAQRALDQCIVDVNSRPTIQTFRMDLGKSINPAPCPDKLILGANSLLLNNEDFIVSQLHPSKPFAYQPLVMQTKFRFIEGYQGNDTVRGWREYDSVYHAVFACMRGTEGYPQGRAYQVIPGGLLLRPAIPSPELFGQSSTYGPQANFKISLRELPDHGRFRVTVQAARYEDGLLVDKGSAFRETPLAIANSAEAVTANLSASAEATVAIEQAGIYQIDVAFRPTAEPQELALTLGDRHFAATLAHPHEQFTNGAAATDEAQTPFLVIRLPSGPLRITARHGDNSRLRRLLLTRLSDDSAAARAFAVFERRTPRLGVHVGLRRDCGSTLAPVGSPQTVTSCGFNDFVFEGAIGNFPSPDVEKDNVNYLAGVREIGVRSEYTDGRDMPRLLIKSIEFEGPLYDSWPPPPHRGIFLTSPAGDATHNPAAYAREVIRSLATRAFRRPVQSFEEDSLVRVWQNAFDETADFYGSVKDALLVVLTSPQFLFLIENSETPAAEPLDSYELASKLSYFLWNSSPDERLLQRAAEGTLHDLLAEEVDRLIDDPRFGQFAEQFASQWLSLDRLDVVETDGERYPKLTRDTKMELRKEPVEYLRHLIRHNLPLRDLVQSDFLLVNEVVADYYELSEQVESGFAFVPVKHNDQRLGGLLSQAGILAGLSNGHEPNPIKRGAWLARKIIAEPPDDPPPNVPKLPDDDGTKLTLRERLERHRSQDGCVKCHAGIDPWGLPLQEFDAGGRFQFDQADDSRSTLPDGTNIAGASELKAYLAQERLDQVAFSFLKHLATYATGRSLSFNEIEFLREQGLQLKPAGYRMRDMFQFVVASNLFLEK